MLPMRLLRASIRVALAAFALAGLAPSAGAQTFTEFAIPTAASSPLDIVAGPDGNLWFTESAGNKIGRITTAGVITEFTTASGLSTPEGIVAGPDGNLWFTERAGRIGKITTSGVITEFTLPSPVNTFPSLITVGPDGNLWFTEMGGFNIGRITTAGVITEFPLPNGEFGQPESIVQGSDGNLWFTESNTNKIGKITTAGVITEYPNPDAAAALRVITPGPDGYLFFTEAQTDQLAAITTAGVFKGEATPPTPAPGLGYIGLGPDGAVWFSEQKANQLGRLSLAGGGGSFSEFAIPTPASTPQGVTAGPDGNLWFTEQTGNKIGRFVVPASAETSPLVASVLPASRSVASGNTATAFATIINSGASALNNCQIVPLSSIPASFSYQTTNPSTNALTGSPNTPVTIAGGNGSQSFVIALTSNAPFTPINVALSFICNAVDAAIPLVGVNTLLLSGSATAVPDVIALSATPSGDGHSRHHGNFRIGGVCSGHRQCRGQRVAYCLRKYRFRVAVGQPDDMRDQPIDRHVSFAAGGDLWASNYQRRSDAHLLDLRHRDGGHRLLAGDKPHLRTIRGYERRRPRLDQRRGQDAIGLRTSPQQG
jgi:virginiamycin B lyase